MRKALDFQLFHLDTAYFTVAVLLWLTVLAVLLFVSERWVWRPLIRRLLKPTRAEAGTRHTFSEVTGLLYLAVGLYALFQMAGIDLKAALSYQFPFHLGKEPFTLWKLLELLTVTIVVFATEPPVRRYLIRRVLEQTHLEPPMRYAISRLMGYAYIGVGLYAALLIAGIDLSSLAVIAGAVGVGLGFGLQNIISNFVSGLIILAERPIALGDRIDVGGVMGRVTKISLRSTAVVTNDNITIIIPNSNFITSNVTNWSYGDPKVRLRLPVGVAYGSDMEKVRRVLLEMAAQHPKVLRDPPPELFFIEFGDSSLNLELAIWAEDDSFQPRRLRSELNFAIDKTLRENRVEIPFPQRDLHVRSGTLPVEMRPPAPGKAEE
jgi:small-conductance mechanosensitive channel